MKTMEEIKTLLIEQREEFLKKDLGVEREKLTDIVTYTNTPHTVIISGLRRAGKSTLLAQLAHKLYPKHDYFFVNFEDERFIHFDAADFTKLHELLIELFGNQKVFLLDEIQNVDGWERFVRRMQDSGYKFYITGSNASLLSRELGTRLTGRYVPVYLTPFSFEEFLRFRQIPLPDMARLTTVQKGKMKKYFSDYLLSGGIPQALQYPEIDLHKALYDDVLYRDIATRYQIVDVKALKELSFYLFSNIASLISFNKLKELLKLGSVNTVKSYVGYLETSWLLFVINRYAFSVKQQQIANKKIYCIDTGLAKSVAFSFSENRGKLLENAVFLALWRQGEDVYYFKTARGSEVDFYLPKKKLLLQVCQSIADLDTREREVRALFEAMEETGVSTSFIITEDEKEVLSLHGKKILILPIYEWLLNGKLITP
jgi:predicted AAA+ superfamily ATPase